MTFTPKDPNFEQRVRASFARQSIMDTFGAELQRVDPGEADIYLPFNDQLCQQHGYLHAGVVTTIVDSACGYAGLTLMPPDTAVLAVEFKVNFVAPAIGEAILARGRVIRSGRTLTVCSGEAFAITDGELKLVATMLSTVMSVTGRDITD